MSNSTRVPGSARAGFLICALRPCFWPTSIVAIVIFAPPALPADWPMWRGDAQRSGATAEDLPKDLHPRRVRGLSPPMTAWPSEPRLQFDACDEPVVLDGRIFVPSSHNGSVTAFDADSGERLWHFFTEGPVRPAPTAAGLVVAQYLNHGCICNYPLQTSFALVPCEQVEAPPVILRPGAAALRGANRTADVKPAAPPPLGPDKQPLDHP